MPVTTRPSLPPDPADYLEPAQLGCPRACAVWARRAPVPGPHARSRWAWGWRRAGPGNGGGGAGGSVKNNDTLQQAGLIYSAHLGAVSGPLQNRPRRVHQGVGQPAGVGSQRRWLRVEKTKDLMERLSRQSRRAVVWGSTRYSCFSQASFRPQHNV